MDSVDKMVKKIATIENGVYDFTNGQIALIRKGILRIYSVTQQAIATKMEKITSVEEVWAWLHQKQAGQAICFMESGSYFSDNLIIKVHDGEATIFIKD